MSQDKKISVIILSKEESWAKSLISTILGNNSQETQKTENQILTLEHITYKQWDDFKHISFDEHDPDMCLLVGEETFEANDVWQQIEHLDKKAKFIVVLPFECKLTDDRFKSWTLPELSSELEKLAKERKLDNRDNGFESRTLKDFFKNLEKLAEKRQLLLIKRCGENTEAPTPTGQHTATDVSLVLVGMAGTGKSASGNTILGDKLFTSKASSKPVTAKCQVKETKIKDIHVRVIDTPDIFDDDLKSSDEHVKNCKKLCKSDSCVYLLVMHVSRFTDGEREILTKLEKAFGNKVSEKTVIVFTRGGDLQQAEMSLEDFLKSCQPKLKEIIEKCGNRCVVFENSKPDSVQVKNLMDIVVSLIRPSTVIH
ncbi:GTPase IMAP family member 8-like isoform X2 [Pelmatolapia mariae]|uniref:GTPase IMAP family member 8-like isoform X2 n=1 Tax=Pelmatolapia mariae TaxID=158779 RepID=UPI002FE587E3